MAKMLVALFETIHPGSKLVCERDMDHLKGLLQWYVSGIPAGHAFLASLYACPVVLVKGGARRYRITRAAARDLTWWRALVLVAYRNPHVLGADIDSLRRVKVPSVHMRTDASTSVGGGGLVSLTQGGKPLHTPGDAIRWTIEEMRVFQSQKISINTLEYYAAVYFVMLWADLLSERVVHVECDNTAAVSWLMKLRACAGNEAADALTKIFSLFCLTRSIVIVSSHIPGVDNVVADFRSRDLTHMDQGGDEEVCRGMMFNSSTRREVCRRMLHACVTTPSRIDGRAVRWILTELGSGRG